MKRAIATTFLLLSACSGQDRLIEPRDTVSVSPEFTQQEQQAVIAAVEEWASATPGRYSVRISTHGHLIRPCSGGVGLMGETTVSSGPVDLCLFSAARRSLDALHETTLHELGHAFGLPHADRGIMSLYTDGTNYVDDSAVHSWCNVWDCEDTVQ